MTLKSHFPVFTFGGCMGRKENVQNLILLKAFIVLSLICLCMYGLQGIYGFSLFPDEFGYWSSAARRLGYDFSEVSSIGSYYSYGYSLILAPVMKLFSDSILAYRAAVIVNLILQILSFFIILKIIDKVIVDINPYLRVILAGIAVLYPSWVFYTQMTMSEALLFFLYVLVIYLVFQYLENPSLFRGMILAISSLYMYTVHMRTVGVLVAVFLTVLFNMVMQLRDKAVSKGEEFGRRRGLILGVVTVLFLLIGFIICIIIKNNVISSLYSSGQVDSTYVNDYSGQTGKLAELLSLRGIGRFLVSMSGKLLYLGCATFGAGYIGIYSLAKRIRRGNKYSLFILLSAFLQLMVMSVYLLHSADLEANRFDLFLHGRYFDFCVPMLMVFGFHELFTQYWYIQKILVSGGIIAVFGIISSVVAGLNKVGFNDPHGMLMIGMSYFLDEDNVKPTGVIAQNMIFAWGVMALLMLLIWLYRKRKNVYLLCALHILLIALAYNACNHFIYIGQVYIFGDIQVADQISELRSEGYTGDIVLLYEGGKEYIDTVQLRLRDEHIHVEYVDNSVKNVDKVYLESLVSSTDLVLIDFESNLNELISDKYDKSWESGHFDLYYNLLEGDK